jgi:hypothetical protein
VLQQLGRVPRSPSSPRASTTTSAPNTHTHTALAPQVGLHEQYGGVKPDVAQAAHAAAIQVCLDASGLGASLSVHMPGLQPQHPIQRTKQRAASFLGASWSEAAGLVRGCWG